MNFLLTGATGFLGTKLVEQLLARGDQVYYLARGASQKPSFQKALFRPWPGTNVEPDLSGLPPFDAVINLAGEPISQRWSKEVKDKIYASRVDGTRHLVAALGSLTQKPRVLVSGSAVGYYGDCGDEPLPETHPPGSDFLAKICIDWEREAVRARDLGMRVALIRTGTVLAGDGGALPKMLPPFRLGMGAKFGDGKQWMAWIHVEDLIRLLLFAADSAVVDGPLNGSSPQPVTNAEFTRTLGRTLRRPAFLSLPAGVMKILLGEMAVFLFSSLRVEPQAPANDGFIFNHPRLDEALRSLLT